MSVIFLKSLKYWVLFSYKKQLVYQLSYETVYLQNFKRYNDYTRTVTKTIKTPNLQKLLYTKLNSLFFYYVATDFGTTIFSRTLNKVQ